jgi:ADP-ribose pyrophosphatase
MDVDPTDPTDRTDADEPEDDAGDAGGTDDPLAWTTTGSEVAYTCPGFSVRRDDVRLPDGTEGAFHYVEEPPAAVVLPFTPDGEVVLVEEWRQAVGRVSRSLPAGSLEGGEDPAAAARRELAEETGHVADAVEHRCTVEPSNGLASVEHHHFVARGCTPGASQDLDPDESIRVVTLDYPDLLSAVVDGRLADARTVVAVQRYELTRR